MMYHNRIQPNADHLDKKAILEAASLQNTRIDVGTAAHDKRTGGFSRIEWDGHFQGEDIRGSKWQNAEHSPGSRKASCYLCDGAISASRDDNAIFFSEHPGKIFSITARAGFQKLKLNTKAVQ
jgi:hypothetical protein